MSQPSQISPTTTQTETRDILKKINTRQTEESKKTMFRSNMSLIIAITSLAISVLVAIFK